LQADDKFKKYIYTIIKQLNFAEFAYYFQKIDKSKYESEIEDIMKRYGEMSERVKDFDIEKFFDVQPSTRFFVLLLIGIQVERI
jgi:hypothetical protein